MCEISTNALPLFTSLPRRFGDWRADRQIADQLNGRLGVRPDDVMVNLVFVNRADWSFAVEASLGDPVQNSEITLENVPLLSVLVANLSHYAIRFSISNVFRFAQSGPIFEVSFMPVGENFSGATPP
jgi:hypothetical protein